MRGLMITVFLLVMLFLTLQLVGYSHEYIYSETDTTESYSEDTDYNQAIADVKYYFLIGIGLFLMGVYLFFRINPWLGMGLIIPGIIEMVFAASPFISVGKSNPGFESLLVVKFIMSFVVYALIIGAWFINEIVRKKKALSEQNSPESI